MKRGGDAMDDYLATLGLWRKPIAQDGSCLFRAVAEQLFKTQSLHLRVREACINFMDRNQELFEPFIDIPFDHHLFNLRQAKEWAGHVEISAMSLMYKCDFVIYQDINRPPVNVTENQFPSKVLLCFSNGNHYDSVYPQSFVESAAISQSILYELLYQSTFKMESPVELGIDMISHTKHTKQRKDSTSSLSDIRNSPVKDLYGDNTELDSSGESGKEKGDKLGEQHRLPFPYRVAKALDPNIYRNVEYDTWLESRKEQQQREFATAMEMQFTPGDKCQVTLEEHGSRLFNAHIQEMVPDKGPVTVFIEQLGEKHSVPFSSLRPISFPCNSQGWTVVTNGKNHKNLSGYYQKTSISAESEYQNDKRRNRKKKEGPIIIPVGRGQSLPPRLQHLDNDKNQMKNSYGRGKPGYHILASRGRGCMIRSPASHISIQGLTLRGRQRSGSEGDGKCYSSEEHFYGNGDQLNGDDNQGEIEIKSNDLNAFPALPNQQEENKPMDRQIYCCSQNCESLVSAKEETSSNGIGDIDPQVQIKSLSVNGPALMSNHNPYTVELPTPSSQYHGAIQPPPPPPPPPQQPLLLPPGTPIPGYMAPTAVRMPFYQMGYLTVPNVENFQGINYSPHLSLDPSGADLPHGDTGSLRFYYNLGCEYYRHMVLHHQQLQQQQQQPYTMYLNGGHMVYPSHTNVPNCEVPSGVAEEDTNGQCENSDKDVTVKNKQSQHSVAPSVEQKPLNNTSIVGKRQVVSVSDLELKVDTVSSCDCQCYGGEKNGINDSGCVSDVSSGNGEFILGVEEGMENLKMSSVSPRSQAGENSENENDTSSQHSLSNGSTVSSISEGGVSHQERKYTNNKSQFFSQKKYFNSNQTTPTTKVIRPMKDIPPRFKKLLAERLPPVSMASHYEGHPLIRNINITKPRSRYPKGDTNKIRGERSDLATNPHYSFNPNAQSFVPGQSVCKPEVENTTAEAVSECDYFNPENQQDYACNAYSPNDSLGTVIEVKSNQELIPEMCGDTPTYTIHIVNSNCDNANSGNCDNVSNSITSPTVGYVTGPPPPPGSPSASHSQGTVYYTGNQGFTVPPSGYVQYPPQTQPQIVYSNSPVPVPYVPYAQGGHFNY